MKLYPETTALFVLTIFSISACVKTVVTNENLGLIYITTPKEVAAGQDIIVKLELEHSPGIDGIHFLGFKTVEKSNHTYVITAPAIITSRRLSVVPAISWTLDTTYVLPTNSPGLYILQYDDDIGFGGTDTVLVR